ncbi:MAG: crossover junction endodeoxyribonuclease RuvC [Saprospiraceae bacterium]|nr:crossover junction endodeoxyribonuclease RuvC [Saprospiraceae bacterium]
MDSKKINSSGYRILGVDPGTNILGYAILEVVSNHLRIIDFGVISLLKYADHTEKLKEIFLQLQEIIETYQPTQMAIESPFYGKNVQSMLKLGRAQGVSMAAGITMGLSIEEYAPKKVKLSITGNGNASKEQVASMLENILKIKIESKYLDATDALGVAVCHFNQKGIIQNTVKKEGVKKKMDWSAFVKDNPTKVLKNK